MNNIDRYWRGLTIFKVPWSCCRDKGFDDPIPPVERHAWAHDKTTASVK